MRQPSAPGWSKNEPKHDMLNARLGLFWGGCVRARAAQHADMPRGVCPRVDLIGSVRSVAMDPCDEQRGLAGLSDCTPRSILKRICIGVVARIARHPRAEVSRAARENRQPAPAPCQFSADSGEHARPADDHHMWGAFRPGWRCHGASLAGLPDRQQRGGQRPIGRSNRGTGPRKRRFSGWHQPCIPSPGLAPAGKNRRY